MRTGMAVLRTVIGVLFIGHGLQKLKGWFGGKGLDATAQGFAAMGIEPAKPQAATAGLTETVAGTLLVVGLATPLAASMVSGVMTVAIRRVHAVHGVWVMEGGFEYNAVLMASMFAITANGPGALSLDDRFGVTRRGTGYACGQLGAGVAGAAIIELIAQRLAAAKQSRTAARDDERQDLIDLRGDHAPAESGPVVSPDQVPSAPASSST